MPPKLLVSVDEANRLIGERIHDGEKIEARLANSSEHAAQIDSDIDEWRNLTGEELQRIFVTEENAAEFMNVSAALHGEAISFNPRRSSGPRQQIDPRQEIEQCLAVLRGIRKNLALNTIGQRTPPRQQQN